MMSNGISFAIVESGPPRLTGSRRDAISRAESVSEAPPDSEPGSESDMVGEMLPVGQD